jgi:hypothetical protein
MTEQPDAPRESQLDRMMAFASIVDGLPPRLSEEVDSSLYV